MEATGLGLAGLGYRVEPGAGETSLTPLGDGEAAPAAVLMAALGGKRA
jgi:hypothetical protein